MSAQIARSQESSSVSAEANQLDRGREILRDEISALQHLSANLDETFVQGVGKIVQCRGNVIVSGIGKAGIVGQKLAASLASTGTPSHFLHPSEAVHGDLGSVRADDLALLLSYSGETDEVIRLLPFLNDTAAATVAITSHAESTLARNVDLAILVGRHREACTLGLAPSSTTTLMMALGDALALVASERRGFTPQQFATFHPGGSLGRQFANVKQVMRPLGQCRVAPESLSVRNVFVHVCCPGRRTGAIMLTDTNGRLVGIFTDSDLARLLEESHDDQLDSPISTLMTRDFQTVGDDCRFPDAMRILSNFKISELPVVDMNQRPLGIVDITDVVGTLPGHFPKDELSQAHVRGMALATGKPKSPDSQPTDSRSVRNTDPSETPRILPLSKWK